MSAPSTRRGSVIVVGSGIAGLVTAIEASRTHDVLVLTKAELSQSNTRYAQGGIAAVLSDTGHRGTDGRGVDDSGADGSGTDSVAAHVADTIAAGAGLTWPAAAETLCAEGPGRVADLIAWGVDFDRAAGDGLSRGLEAAHSAARVLHAGGDATGAALQAALVREVRRRPVEIAEHTFVRDLIVEDGRAVGVSCLGAGGGPVEHRADAVVLASGGAGQLFPHTTNPLIATGDGVAAALRAGAVVTDLELYQFHPTALAVPGSALVSEAVRGDGAVLLDVDGHRFMPDIHPDAELAPRDVVARGIAGQMARQHGAPVLLDATGLGADFLRRRFPSIDAICRSHGYDWTAEPVPVTPAAHYWMGGVRTDLDGRSSIPGLYAVGEVACTGVHGANRLASNSLLEGAVYAHRCARALAGGDASVGEPEWVTVDEVHLVEPDQYAAGTRVADVRGADVRAADVRGVVDRYALQRLMWDAAGLYRSGDRIADALAVLADWRPGAAAPVACCEDANLLDLARAMLAAADARRESRGAHFRTDFPTSSPDVAGHVALTRKVPAPC